MIPVVLCAASVTDSPVPMTCTLASRPVSYPDWLVTDACCLICEYGDVWLALQLVMTWWVPWSGKYGMNFRSTSLATVRQVLVSSVKHICLDINDIVHSLWWYCIPASWHFYYTRDKVTWLWHVWYCKCENTFSNNQ